MENNQDYIKWIRSNVGHEKIILVFVGGCIINDKREVLLQRRGDSKYFSLERMPELFCKQHQDILCDLRNIGGND